MSIDESNTREGITTVTPLQTHLQQPEQLYTESKEEKKAQLSLAVGRKYCWASCGR